MADQACKLNPHVQFRLGRLLCHSRQRWGPWQRTWRNSCIPGPGPLARPCTVEPWKDAGAELEVLSADGDPDEDEAVLVNVILQ